MSEQLYYIQNVERGFVGNSVQWWRHNGSGYTCDVRAARKFTEAEALNLVQDRLKYAMHRCEYIDGLVQHHIDMQDLRYSRLVPHTIADLVEFVDGGKWRLK
jgi:hypothetical protein